MVGFRPERFEEAALPGDARDRGFIFKAKIDLEEGILKTAEYFEHQMAAVR